MAYVERPGGPPSLGGGAHQARGSRLGAQGLADQVVQRLVRLLPQLGQLWRRRPPAAARVWRRAAAGHRRGGGSAGGLLQQLGVDGGGQLVQRVGLLRMVREGE